MTRIGIVGIGAIARLHALAIADIDGAQLVGGCCRTAEKGQRFMDEFGGRWYPTAEALMDAEQPEVITICTPSGAHLEPAVAAAARGIHVLCEKPLEINLQRARQLIQATQEGGVLLGGIFPQRFNPVVATVHQAAQAGRFGQLAMAVAYVPWWRDDAYYGGGRWQGTQALDGGGALINQSIHAIDAIQWIAAAAGAGPVVEVFGYTAQRGHDPQLIEVEDTAVASLRFEQGALGAIVASTAMWPGDAQRIHLSGRDGTAEVHEQSLMTWRFREESSEDEAIRQRFAAQKGAGGASDPMAIDYSNHTRNIEDFLAAIRAGKASSVDGSEATKALGIIRGIYESVETGRPVSL